MSVQSIKREVLEKLVGFATAAFGLVAALAWNDAIQELFKTIFPEQGTLVAKLGYAALVTTIAVIITIELGKLTGEQKKA